MFFLMGFKQVSVNDKNVFLQARFVKQDGSHNQQVAGEN